MESIASKGKKVAEGDVISLIEQLMNQLLRLDGLVVEGDVKLQRRTQVTNHLSSRLFGLQFPRFSSSRSL